MRLNHCLLCSICTSELNHEKISFHRTSFKDNRTQPSLLWISFSLYDETCVLEDPTTECEFCFEMCSHRTRRWNILWELFRNWELFSRRQQKIVFHSFRCSYNNAIGSDTELMFWSFSTDVWRWKSRAKNWKVNSVFFRLRRKRLK